MLLRTKGLPVVEPAPLSRILPFVSADQEPGLAEPQRNPQTANVNTSVETFTTNVNTSQEKHSPSTRPGVDM